MGPCVFTDCSWGRGVFGENYFHDYIFSPADRHGPALPAGLCLLPTVLCWPLLGASEPNQPADGEARGCFGGVKVRREGGLSFLGPELVELRWQTQRRMQGRVSGAASVDSSACHWLSEVRPSFGNGLNTNDHFFFSTETYVGRGNECLRAVGLWGGGGWDSQGTQREQKGPGLSKVSQSQHVSPSQGLCEPGRRSTTQLHPNLCPPEM